MTLLVMTVCAAAILGLAIAQDVPKVGCKPASKELHLANNRGCVNLGECGTSNQTFLELHVLYELEKLACKRNDSIVIMGEERLCKDYLVAGNQPAPAAIAAADNAAGTPIADDAEGDAAADGDEPNEDPETSCSPTMQIQNLTAHYLHSAICAYRKEARPILLEREEEIKFGDAPALIRSLCRKITADEQTKVKERVEMLLKAERSLAASFVVSTFPAARQQINDTDPSNAEAGGLQQAETDSDLAKNADAGSDSANDAGLNSEKPYNAAMTNRVTWLRNAAALIVSILVAA